MAILLFCRDTDREGADRAGLFAVLCRKWDLRPDSKSRPIQLLANCAHLIAAQNGFTLIGWAASTSNDLLDTPEVSLFLFATAKQKRGCGTESFRFARAGRRFPGEFEGIDPMPP